MTNTQAPVWWLNPAEKNLVMRKMSKVFILMRFHFLCLKIEWNLTHSEWRPQNIYSQEEINLYCIIKLATEISFISVQSSKTWMFCVDKIKYEHLAILSNLKSCQFAPRIVIFNLCICCQFEDSQIISPKK